MDTVDKKINKDESETDENSSQTNIIEESLGNTSISSSSDDSFTKIDQEPINIPVTSHECSYFEETNQKCSHMDSNLKTISQNVCLGCEFVKEINDSLDHMAFLSPEKKNEKSNFINELKFDSPTQIEEKKTEEIVDDNMDIPDIINDTLTEEDLEKLNDKTLNETQNTLVDKSCYEEDDFGSKSQSEISFNVSRRSSMSETTLMLSDSDYEDENEDEFLKEYYEN